MKLPASALAAVLLGSSAAARAAAKDAAARRQLQETKVDGDCDDDRKCNLCEGDCDEDSNCKGDMLCGQRDDGEKVPGCALGKDDRPDVDYCWDPNWKDEKEEEADNGDEKEFDQDQDDIDTDEMVTPALDTTTTTCGGPVIKRAQECGAGSNLPQNCCPGYKCRGDGAVRCEIDPDASIADDSSGINTSNAADEGVAVKEQAGAIDIVDGGTAPLTLAPSSVRLATPSPSLSPVKITPKPTRQVQQTERPTRESEKKSRTWATILTKQKLVRSVMKQENKLMKRVITQERDPFRFTEEPSAMPSSLPSVRPSLRPSLTPSASPSASPSDSPTFAPTKMRKDECKIEMYYEKKWCWHDDAQNSDCDIDYQFCVDKSGDELLMEDCGGSEFEVIGFTVRPKSDNKRCWTRRGDGGIRLDDCDDKGDGKWKDQQWDGVCQKKPHMITPLSDKKWCLTQGHEPRNGERLKLQECDKVDNSKTHLWIRK
eukprot:CAMPEP_0181043256 /NCGR_PEP_ID=MMETSP1070-20121207/12607_1 /TAXON_ID=265543 /ORGANISM="Minutocellus polymorphus, Strain NH13" /LENGTH=484 /DNA_ID=CAMNT_0023121565 /DNA_START=73 /DNA_END=1527 /DNA_ORIENTATION=+